MNLSEIRSRITAVETEMRGIYDSANSAGEDLTGAPLEKWNALEAERRDLRAKEDRAKTRDELDRMAAARPVTRKAEGDHWGLTREQRMTDFVGRKNGTNCEELSVGRLLTANLRGDRKGAEAELRAMGSGANATGAFLLSDEVSANVIDLVRAKSVMVAGGATTVPLIGASLNLARIDADPTSYWRAEGVAITESDPTLGSTLISPNTVGCLIRVSAELMDDAPNLASVLDNLLAQALATELDRVALYGSGLTSEPLGLRNLDTSTGVNEISMGTNGAALADYDDILDLIRDCELDNGAPDVAIMSPRTKNSLAQLKTGISSDLTKLTAPADYQALRRLVSNQIPTDETQGSSNAASTIFVGGFQHVALCIRQGITIEASRTSGTAFAQNEILVRGIMRADVAFLRPNQLGRLVGITA